jgi:peptidoglycan/LPS O-acetylase OafA/YrhL
VAEAVRSANRIPTLDGLRFIAAFGILLHHSCGWIGNFTDSRAVANVGEFFGGYAMPLFFVLSGFVIHYTYAGSFQRMRWRWAALEFAGSRFARLYPLFICLLAFGSIVSGFMTWVWQAPRALAVTLAHALTLTQSWVYITMFGDRTIIDNGFAMSWSISTEVFFYVCYAFCLARLIAGMDRRATLFSLVAVSVAAVAGLSTVFHFRPEISISARDLFGPIAFDGEHSVFKWLFYFSPYSRILEFVVGCFVAQLYMLDAKRAGPAFQKMGWIPHYSLTAAVILLLGFGLLHLVPGFNLGALGYLWFLRTNFGCALPLGVLIYCVARYDTPMGRLIAAPAMVTLGEFSYSIYAVHTWTVPILVRPPQPLTIGLAAELPFRIAAAIAVTLVLSFATYKLIEVPGRRALRRWSGAALEKWLGPKEINRALKTESPIPQIALLVGLLAALVAYQFVVVPALGYIGD